MSPQTHISMRPRRIPAMLAIGALALVSLATAATAQSAVQLNMALGTGNRTLNVTDITGAPLTNLTMRPGQASTYRVSVTDVDYLVNEAFSVRTVNGNLYRVTGAASYDFSQSIPASAVTLGVSPGTQTGLGVDLTPVFELTGGTFDLTSCGAALTGLTVTQATSVCTAFVAARLDGAAPLNGLDVADSVIADLDLTGLIDGLIGLADGTGGAYTIPSFAGIGSADPAAAGAATPTNRTVMSATPPATLAADVLTRLTNAVAFAGTEKVSQVLPVSSVLQALVNTGNATAGTLSSTISGLPVNVQDDVIDALFSITLLGPTLAQLSNLVGVYTAFPTLTVSQAAANQAVAGTYSGTHTVTITSP